MQYLDVFKRLIVPIGSYGFIVYLFGNALFNPEDSINFIYNVGIFMFVTEFLSVHSAVMLSAPEKTSQKLLVLPVYLIFILFISMATHTYIPAIVFALSLAAKITRKSDASLAIAYPAILLVISLSVVILFSDFISNNFSLSQIVLDQKPEGSSGLFVDQPQTLLMWGILYYSGLIALNVWQAINESKKHQLV